jgi:anti-sigma regulatory factor (Ser/Thr protein kinase)
MLLTFNTAAVRVARVAVAETCAAAGIEEASTDDAVLLTSEIVTNALVHGRSEARLTVTVTRGLVRVEVSDDNSRHPRTVERDVEALSGRGVEIVASVASRWGVRDDLHGKTVWFEIDVAKVPGA